MNKEKQRILIAEACGWEMAHPGIRGSGYFKSGMTVRFEGDLPDYLNDLNDCHEMENVLTLDQQERFVCVLDRMLHGGRASDLSECFVSLHATAAQRCEAFLRTLNLWEQES
jgi:hypothetical protein